MATEAIAYLDEPDQVRAALSPLRRELLHHLRTPSSATRLAATLELPRQRVNYHLRALEAAGLVELVEERPRRGCVERIVRARADAVVVDPAVMAGDRGEPAARIQDQYAAEHLVAVAADAVRDVARMRAKADAQDRRLLTFTIEAEGTFAGPTDVHAFTEELADTVRQLLARYASPTGRPYRLIGAGYPAPARDARPTSTQEDSP